MAAVRSARQVERVGNALAVHVMEEARERPVAGADVMIFRPKAEDAEAWSASDADGVARFDGLSVGLVAVVASHPDLGTGLTLAALSERPAEARVVLAGSGRVEGTISDEEGAPVPDARVVSGTSSTLTDAFGRFVLEGLTRRLTLPTGASLRRMLESVGEDPEEVDLEQWDQVARQVAPGWVLTVRAEGFAPWQGEADPEAPLQVTLRRLWSVRGRVLREGRPVADALVRIEGIVPPETGKAQRKASDLRRERQVRTGPDGVFLLDGLMLMGGHLEAAEGGLRSDRQWVSPSIERDVLLELETPEPLMLRVRSRLTGRPLVGVTAVASGASVQTDAEGVARLELVPGRQEIVLSGPQVVPQQLTVAWEDQDEDASDLEVLMDHAWPFVVLVQTASGEPVPDAHIEVEGRPRMQGWTLSSGEAPMWLPRPPYALRIHLPEGRTARYVVEQFPEDGTIRVRLPVP